MVAPREPRTDRPRLFGGEIDPTPLPWSWATARLRDARNSCIATTRADGRARVVEEQPLVLRVVAAYDPKYRWHTDPDDLPGPFYEVRPDVAFGWISDESGLDGGSAFHGTNTRWRF